MELPAGVAAAVHCSEAFEGGGESLVPGALAQARGWLCHVERMRLWPCCCASVSSLEDVNGLKPCCPGSWVASQFCQALIVPGAWVGCLPAMMAYN